MSRTIETITLSTTQQVGKWGKYEVCVQRHLLLRWWRAMLLWPMEAVPMMRKGTPPSLPETVHIFVIICIFIPSSFCLFSCLIICWSSVRHTCLWLICLTVDKHNTEKSSQTHLNFLWINVTCDLLSLGLAGMNVVFVRAVSLDFHLTKNMDLPADLFIFLHFSWVTVFPMDYVCAHATTYHFT